ncbi:MAG: GTP cyclohydrolase I FolE [Gemmatimonadota bacterium]|jgi:GTP cyclohydrolase I|nr:GTP cyclohydrolase I FolE [Gemmatimonadota bacterium]MDP6528126.1 GTP cyclohydrolase I FolE [Gemmatimonadota bacterium]MDP6802572.1 GTP cyclohydrolase I FolE [Gemmatimonadota bacterium]MDP7032739.1 GTP cyclohydrolase I FolE [Gemmatimonadota bacterium]
MTSSPAPSGNPRLQNAIRILLGEIGESPEREGLLRTPARVETAWTRLAEGYLQDPEEILEGAVFEEDCQEMVVVRDIEMYSMCEHHLLPFFGRCHVAYLPKGRIVGLSKIARLVEVFSRRLQVQERLTSQIALALQEGLAPHGVGVVVEARHLCMMMRGVEKQGSSAVTSCLLGEFRDNMKTRSEFLNLVSGRPVP